ncbi:hypothetical protein [Methylomonas denitrificans]|nr:hypothetical protein [Methylomonas denitrificans]
MSRIHRLKIVIGRKFPADRFTPVTEKSSLTKSEALDIGQKNIPRLIISI